MHSCYRFSSEILRLLDSFLEIQYCALFVTGETQLKMQDDYEVGVSNRFNLLLDQDALSKIEQIPTHKKTRKVTLMLPDGKFSIKLADKPKKLKASSIPEASIIEKDKSNVLLLHTGTKHDGLQTSITGKHMTFKDYYPKITEYSLAYLSHYK
jgi:hypothetical protein